MLLVTMKFNIYFYKTYLYSFIIVYHCTYSYTIGECLK